MKTRNDEMMKAIFLLKRLFEKNSDEMEALSLYIQRDGIVEFLKKLDTYEISSELYEGLYAVKVIVFTLEEMEGFKGKGG